MCQIFRSLIIFHGCPQLTRIKSWYHSKFQVILAIFGPLIPKLCSDKSENVGKLILISHLLIHRIWRIFSKWKTSIHFPILSGILEHSFWISGPNVAGSAETLSVINFYTCGAGGNCGLWLLLGFILIHAKVKAFRVNV